MITLQEFAATVSPDTQALLHTKTALKMNKKDIETKSIPNPYTEIFKTSTVRVTLNASYQDRVNEQRLDEGKEQDFKAQEMKYGKMVGNALLETNDQLYVKCIEEERIGKSTYVDSDGNVVSYDDLKPFIPVSKSTGSQGVESTVKVRNFKLSSITSFEIL